MITIKKKHFFFTITEKWFDYKFSWSDLFLPVCYRGLRENNQRLFFGVKKYTKTAVLALDKPIDELYANFLGSVKRDIKKATAEGVECYFDNNREKFISFYNQFAKVKGLSQIDISRADEYAIPEWTCSYAVLNGELLVAHSYLEDNTSGIVRSMESGSLRFDEQHSSRQIAQANKLLHYHDIKAFTERGLSFYDFGGWQASEDGHYLPGLLEFKESFGAYPINIFNFFTYAYELKEKVKKLRRL